MKNLDWTENNDKSMQLMVMAVLDKIRKELDRCYWNKNQKEMSSPFDNTGTSYSNDYLQINAYSWGEDEEYKPNFITPNMKVNWYKHSNRGIQVYFRLGFNSYSTLADVLNKSIYSIQKDFGEKN